MKKTIAILSLFLAAAWRPGHAQAAPAPDFKIAKVINGPVAKINGLKDLKGKVVFLDFWATWCAPCVASLPHVNKLHEALKGQPVVFIAVTDEAPDKITEFLKTHEIKSWVGLDQLGSVFKAYKVVGRPDGYLIGKDGRLLARISPGHLEEQDVRDAIAGKFEARPIEWEDPKAATMARADTGKTYFEIRISSGSGKWKMSSTNDGFEMQGMPLKYAIAKLWDVKGEQVILDTKPVDSLNIKLKTSEKGFARGNEILRTAIQSALDISVTSEPKETEVFVLALSTVPGAPLPKAGAPEVHLGLMEYGGGRLLGTAPMPDIARAFGASLDKPVVDETGLKGGYEFDLKWKYGDQAELDGLLAKEGLALVPARRTIEFVHVTPAKP